MTSKHGHAKRGQKSAEYNAWVGMKDRCNNPAVDSYVYYGARGIKVCEEWADDFPRFLSDMGPRPSPRHSLDRFPDGNSNYEPGNVRWATSSEQALNRRQGARPRVQYDGRPLAEVAKERGISPKTAFKKWRQGLRDERLFLDGRRVPNC